MAATDDDQFQADIEQALINSKSEILHTPGANTQKVSGNLADVPNPSQPGTSKSKVFNLFQFI